MHCTVGERFGEQQMFRYDSALSKEGRDICRALESKTGVPVYYFLFKYRGKSDSKEKSRRCPNCGGEWLLEARWHDLFHFRCDRCHLLSNVACGL